MKPFIVICACLLWMTSCHPADTVEPPVDPPVVPPAEEGTPLLLEPNEMVTITVADETFMVDFSRSNDIQVMYDWVNLPFPLTWEAYVARYAKKEAGGSSFATDAAMLSVAEFVRIEYILAQGCFSDDCTSEKRKEVLQLAIDKQRPKYENPHGWLVWSIQTGVFLMAVILVKERVYSVDFIDAGTLQQALLFLNDYDDFPDEENIINFSNLIVDCAQNFLTENK